MKTYSKKIETFLYVLEMNKYEKDYLKMIITNNLSENRLDKEDKVTLGSFLKALESFKNLER